MNLGELNKEFRFLMEKYQTKFSNKEILNSIKSNIDSLNSGPNQDEIVIIMIIKLNLITKCYFKIVRTIFI